MRLGVSWGHPGACQHTVEPLSWQPFDVCWAPWPKQNEKVIKSDVWIEKDVCVKNNYFVLHDLEKDKTIVTHSFLGLGFPNGKYKTFLENMRDQNFIDEIAFSFYFNVKVSNNPILYIGS